jgi:hypothetical protein
MDTRDTVCAIAADASAAALTLPDEPTWRLAGPYYQLALEHDAESRLAICNGVLGVRASLEQPTSASRPRTFVAGVFDAPGNPTRPYTNTDAAGQAPAGSERRHALVGCTDGRQGSCRARRVRHTGCT